ncbi:hypothetical protein ACO0QE_001934 [Hanseniaspora vineae]
MAVKNRNTSKSKQAPVPKPDTNSKQKTADPADAVEEVATTDENKFDFLTEVLCTNRVMQIMIFLATCHLFYFQNENNSPLLSKVFNTLISFVIVFFVYYRRGALNITIENFEKNYFQLIYLFLLPIGITIYYAHPRMQYLGVNCALVLNYLPVPPHLKLPLQGIFALINAEDPYFYDYKFHYLVAIALNYCIYFVLTKVSQLKSLSVIECNLFAILSTNLLYLYQSESVEFQILQKSLWSLIIIATVNWLLDLSFFHKSTNAASRKIVLGGITLLGFPFLLQTFLSHFQSATFSHNAVQWLYQYIVEDPLKLKILGVWMASLLILIPNIFIIKSMLSLNTSRKLWHFIIFLLITIPFKYDPEFVKLGISGVVPLFLLVEYLRYTNLCGNYINNCLKSFSDYRDSAGPIVISYLYLIIGVSFPLLINNDICGCVVLGVGDSIASMIGKKFGKKYWDGPDNKTMEGTTAFVVSTFALSLILKAFYNDWDYLPILANKEQLFEIFTNCFVAGILEGNATFNDNILLPPFMMIFSKVMKW